MWRLKINDLAYMAGVFDGEGYISIHRKYGQGGHIGYCLLAGVNMVDKVAVGLFHLAFGGSFNQRKGCNIRSRPSWRWRVESKKAYEFLCIIEPFLRVKSVKAELAITFQESKKTYNYKPQEEKDAELSAYNRMKILNRRGTYVLETRELAQLSSGGEWGCCNASASR